MKSFVFDARLRRWFSRNANRTRLPLASYTHAPVNGPARRRVLRKIARRALASAEVAWAARVMAAVGPLPSRPTIVSAAASGRPVPPPGSPVTAATVDARATVTVQRASRLRSEVMMSRYPARQAEGMNAR